MTPLLARTPSADRQFERMYQRYVGDVYRYSLAVLRNAQDAEDVTQTTFLNALRAMQNGERPETPKNWLIAIAHNVCRQRFRQAQRRPQESQFFEDAAEAAVPESEERYSAEDIQRALGQLAFNQRAALTMRELEGRSYAEIAEIMGTSVSAVETVLFRARRALREQLEGSLSCAEAEFFLSKQVDGELARGERGQLRAHLRECPECETLARKQRASRGALKALLGGIPLPASLWGGSGLTLGLGAKAAAIVCAGARRRHRRLRGGEGGARARGRGEGRQARRTWFGKPNHVRAVRKPPSTGRAWRTLSCARHRATPQAKAAAQPEPGRQAPRARDRRPHRCRRPPRRRRRPTRQRSRRTPRIPRIRRIRSRSRTRRSRDHAEAPSPAQARRKAQQAQRQAIADDDAKPASCQPASRSRRRRRRRRAPAS